MTDQISPSNPVGWIWDIKRYALHDGPGIRTTVFFKGCPLSCLWCCNPESQNFKPELTWIKERCLDCGLCEEACPHSAVKSDSSGYRIIDYNSCDLCGKCADLCPGEALNLLGRQAGVDEVLEEACKDAVFYQRSGGGLTLSGGEPLAQPNFATAILHRYKTEEGGLNTVVETSGYADWKHLARVARYTDLFLFDIKHMDPADHYRLTGVSNSLILENAKKLSSDGFEMVIRIPVIPGMNDDHENIRLTALFARDLKRVKRVDLLPYHRLGEPKYQRLGRAYDLAGTPALSETDIVELKKIVEETGLEARIGG